MEALEAEWCDLMFLLGDELSVADPRLLAGISRRAFHGRARLLGLGHDDILEHSFGDVPLQAFMADFLQLNPVRSHTLLEAHCRSLVPGVPRQTADEDRDGYETFRRLCKNVILFTGTHRYLDEDLPALLNIMRTPGGRLCRPSCGRRCSRASKLAQGTHASAQTTSWKASPASSLSGHTRPSSGSRSRA